MRKLETHPIRVYTRITEKMEEFAKVAVRDEKLNRSAIYRRWLMIGYMREVKSYERKLKGKVGNE